MDKDKEIARLKAEIARIKELLKHEVQASIKSSHYKGAIWREWQRVNNVSIESNIMKYREILRRQKYQIIDDFVLAQFDKHFFIEQ